MLLNVQAISYGWTGSLNAPLLWAPLCSADKMDANEMEVAPWFFKCTGWMDVLVNQAGAGEPLPSAKTCSCRGASDDIRVWIRGRAGNPEQKEVSSSWSPFSLRRHMTQWGCWCPEGSVLAFGSSCWWLQINVEGVPLWILILGRVTNLYQLVLSLYLHHPESHQLSLHKGNLVSESVSENRTHRSDPRDTWVR